MRVSSSNRSILLSLKGWGLAVVTGATLFACSPDPAPPVLHFTTGQNASLVIGQADFVSGSANRGAAANDNTMNNPYGTPVVASNGVLYLPDYENARVLGYNTVPAINGASANFVLGQPNFVTTTPQSTATGMDRPEGAVTYNGKLLVVDYGAHRVMIWNTLPASSNVPADVVVGQVNKTANANGCAQQKLSYPEGIAVIDGGLVVADTGNNRLLAWNTIPTVDGTDPDLVLGQPDFTTCGGGTTATKFNVPTGVVRVGTKLVVADTDNNRLLIWNSIPSSAATPADVVVGQPDFISSASNNGGLSAHSLGRPYGLATDGTRLAVADFDNHRVLIWNTVPTCTPVPCASTTGADVVLGQPDFTSNASALSAQGLNRPSGVYFNGPNQLFVADNSNNRSLIFNAHF